MTTTPNNLFGEIPAHMYAIEHKKIVDSLTLAVMLVDEELLIQYLNPSAEELLGTGVRHALNHALTDFFQDTDGALIPHIQKSVQTGHPFSEHEVSIKRIGGNEITLDCLITPMLSDEKQKVCMLEFTQIDRMLRISRDELLLSETQATQNMLRGLAHEIKNPLGGLRGAAQLLAGELEQEDLHEYTDVIISEADRLRKLIDRMFGPKVHPNKTQLNIHDVLEHIRHLAMAEMSNEINIAPDYDPSIPEFFADPDLLVQAILNILRNAINAVGDTGNITLRTRVERQFTIGEKLHRLVIKISVNDDGSGVADELKHQIFFPMVSGHEEGTGLGLPISQNLINLHGGIIEFESVPGDTRFHIFLPIEEANKF